MKKRETKNLIYIEGVNVVVKQIPILGSLSGSILFIKYGPNSWNVNNSIMLLFFHQHFHNRQSQQHVRQFNPPNLMFESYNLNNDARWRWMILEIIWSWKGRHRLRSFPQKCPHFALQWFSRSMKDWKIKKIIVKILK